MVAKHAAEILVATAVVGALAAVAAYHIARFMRGAIKLTLPRTAFGPGESITGRFVLHTKKAIEGNRLIVSLIGVQVTTTREEGKPPQTRTREIYRDDVLVEEAKPYPAGLTATYTFQLSIPDTGAPEFLSSTAGRVLTEALALLSHQSTRLKWRIEARLDAKGIDLAASQPVSLRAGPLL